MGEELTSTINLALLLQDGVTDIFDLVIADVSVSFTVEAVVEEIGDTDRRDLIDVTIVVGTDLPLELFEAVGRIKNEVTVDELAGAETTVEMGALTDEAGSKLEVIDVTVSRKMLDASCGSPGAVRGGVKGTRIDSEALVEDAWMGIGCKFHGYIGYAYPSGAFYESSVWVQPVIQISTWNLPVRTESVCNAKSSFAGSGVGFMEGPP